MDTAESVSRGCFAYKGKKKIARAEDYLSDKKHDESMSVRYKVFQKMWEDIDAEIQMLRSDLNSKVFEDLLQFICKNHRETQRAGSVKEVPTAALMTGVNTPDHAIMFSNLASILKERVTSLVATLRAKDCSSVKALLTKLLHQLLSLNELKPRVEKGQRLLFPLFAARVEEHHENSTAQEENQSTEMETSPRGEDASVEDHGQSPRKSPKKKRRASPGDSPVIAVILEDTENFPPNVLQDFVVTCSNYLDRLPIVLVFGIATSVTTVHRLLPTAVSSLLCMEKFQAPPSTHYFSLLIDKILMTNKFPFKLGPRVFQLLLDMFLCHDFSVINFTMAFQFCLLDHYTTNPLAHLCCPRDMIHRMVKNLSAQEVEQMHRLPSVMRHIEQLPGKDLADILESEDCFKKLIQTLLEENFTCQYRSNTILRVLHTLTAHLPTHPLGKQLREQYVTSLEDDITETEGFRRAFDLLAMTAGDEFVSLVTQCLNLVQDSDDNKMEEFSSALQVFLYRLEHLDEEKQEEKKEPAVEKDDLKLQRTDLRSLQKRLQEMGKKKKKLTPYEKVRGELLYFFKENVRRYVCPAKAVVLYEILSYDDDSTVRHHLNAAPRSAIHLALSNPAHYLHCDCCNVEGGSISPSMPDVCIAYKLHLESGQLINLYDWLQAFVSIVTVEEQENKKKGSKPDKLLQARFIQAVSELQFLGFIKPTKRKTDHVARLTWGGC
ncbi:hypothetical protein BaRGS_00016673 [Batillaria attramentaria]|uniref:Origin recognition complex subunit 3 n=1 Tax=Batillaria attramentaria TaxID=370345 RepID=A0ABD0KYX1_9CAEN